MKLNILRLSCAFLLCCSAAYAQQLSFDGRQNATDRGNAVRMAFMAAKTAPIYLPAGLYDFDAPLLMPPVEVHGLGDVRFRSTALFFNKRADGSDYASCCFELNDKTLLDNLTLESVCAYNQQSTLVGFATAGYTAPRVASIRNCKLLGQAWCVYSWTDPDGNSLDIADSDIVAAHVGVAACRSTGGGTSQFIDLHSCRIKLDPARSSYFGAVTNPAYAGYFGIVQRGGRVRAWDTTCEILGGGDQRLRAAMYTDFFDAQGGGKTTAEFHNCKNRMAPGYQGGWDLDVRYNAVSYSGDGWLPKVNGTATKLTTGLLAEKTGS